jgi:ribosomal protein S18 acetylase RimI-like enzyme
MNIRKVADKDFEGINQLYKELYSADEPEVNLVGKKIDAETVSLIAEEDGKIVGFISGTVVNYATKTEGQIWDLIIDKEFRGKGYGKKLVSDFENLVKGLGATYMMVWTDPRDDEDDPAPFYEKLGYKINKNPTLTKKLE